MIDQIVIILMAIVAGYLGWRELQPPKPKPPSPKQLEYRKRFIFKLNDAGKWQAYDTQFKRFV